MGAENTFTCDVLNIPEYSHFQFADCFRILITCRPFMVGFSVQANFHLVENQVKDTMQRIKDYTQSIPSQCQDAVTKELELSLAASYLKKMVSDRVRSRPQNNQALNLVEPGTHFNDFDARLFASIYLFSCWLVLSDEGLSIVLSMF